MDVVKYISLVSPAAAAVASGHSADPPLSRTLIPGAAAGVLAAATWRAHPVLGFLAGDAVGLNAYRLWRGSAGDRPRALCNLTVAGCGIAGSLAWKRHPFYGWVAGFVVGTLATSFVPGSGAHEVLRSGR